MIHTMRMLGVKRKKRGDERIEKKMVREEKVMQKKMKKRIKKMNHERKEET